MSFQDLEAGRGLGGSSRRELSNGSRQDPTQAVASGIFQINTAVSTFQRLVNTLGTPKDTPELREKLWVPIFLTIILFLDVFSFLRFFVSDEYELPILVPFGSL